MVDLCYPGSSWSKLDPMPWGFSGGNLSDVELLPGAANSTGFVTSHMKLPASVTVVGDSYPYELVGESSLALKSTDLLSSIYPS